MVAVVTKQFHPIIKISRYFKARRALMKQKLSKI
jgi:hypothetical protein